VIGGGVVEETEALDAPLAPCPIQEGTVGWPGSKEIVELSKEAGDGLAVALVSATLFCHLAGPGRRSADATRPGLTRVSPARVAQRVGQLALRLTPVAQPSSSTQ
jgi:hypothetical protein